MQKNHQTENEKKQLSIFVWSNSQHNVMIVLLIITFHMYDNYAAL